MNTILKIDRPEIIGLFRKMTNEQLGKIIRAYLNNNPKDLIEDENKIYAELTKHREKQKASNKEKILKGWETRRKNGNASTKAIKKQLQTQLQRNKDEMLKLRTENETLKKTKYWNNKNYNKEDYQKQQEEKRQKEMQERLDRDPKLKATFW